MRGYVPISDFMNAVKDKNVGLSSGKLISYIVMTEIQGIDQLLFLTDGEIITNPSLEDKVHLIENAVEMARLFGIRHPNVAALSPIEYIDPNVKSSVEADILKKMNDQGKIKDCLIEGPISMDMAISLRACTDKAAWTSRIKGDANILLFPDYMASNMSWRLVRYVKRHLAAMLLWGTTKPVVMTGRGDDVWTKINSIVLAKYIDEYLKGNLKGKSIYQISFK
jgi:phosphate butyryltransferase